MNGWTTHRIWHHLKKVHIKTWQLGLITLVLLLLSALALRQNNLKMVELRNAVVVADKTGEGVSESLEALNMYIFDHMNTQVVRPVELVNTYNRKAQEVLLAAQKGSGRDIYAEGTAACERRGIPLSSIAQCIAQYGNDNAPSVAQQKIQLPEKNLFIYSFASPVWTPDVAGILVLLTVVSAAWLVGRVIEYVIVRLVIRHRLKNGF